MNAQTNARTQNITRRSLKSALLSVGVICALASPLSQAAVAQSKPSEMMTYTFTYDFTKKQNVIAKQANELRQNLEFDRLVEIDRQLYSNMMQIGEDVASLNSIAKGKGFELAAVSVDAE